jgi:hypothetical protein
MSDDSLNANYPFWIVQFRRRIENYKAENAAGNGHKRKNTETSLTLRRSERLAKKSKKTL